MHPVSTHRLPLQNMRVSLQGPLWVLLMFTLLPITLKWESDFHCKHIFNNNQMQLHSNSMDGGVTISIGKVKI